MYRSDMKKKMYLGKNLMWWKMIFNGLEDDKNHTAGLDTIFIQIYMEGPPGVPGVSKEPEGKKDQYLDVFVR